MNLLAALTSADVQAMKLPALMAGMRKSRRGGRPPVERCLCGKYTLRQAGNINHTCPDGPTYTKDSRFASVQVS